jgi:hypothetical protein
VGDDTTGNLADFLNNIAQENLSGTNIVSSLMGTFADISGVVAAADIIIQVINSGQPDEVAVALQQIQETIQTAFQQLNADLSAQQIIERNTLINGYLGPAYARFQSLPAALNAQPPLTAADRIAFIEDCITTLDQLNGAAQPDLVWSRNYDWQLYWTDQWDAQNPQTESAYWFYAAYGEQAPQRNADGTVFVPTYSLPLYLWAVYLFLAVGLSLDTNFKVNYAGVLRSIKTLLKTRHDEILNSGITQLTPPDWTSQGVLAAARNQPGFGSGQPDPGKPGYGISLFGIPLGGKPPHSRLLGVYIEYGAVEKFSGTSSVGYRYKILVANSEDAANQDPAIYRKLQLRVMKRTKEVYSAVGLPQVVQAINQISDLLGESEIPFPGYADWSFRAIFTTSGLAANNGFFTLRSMSDMLIKIQPNDTPYANVPPTGTMSVRQLLTGFTD